MPVTAEDVKYTFDQWKIQQMPRMLPYVENIENIEVVDDKTVVMKLYEIDTTFLSRTLSWPALMIAPKHIWKDIEDWNTFLNDDPELHIGSGPFKLQEWKKGEYCIMEANENYWQGRPYLDSITYIVIKMRDMQLMAFEKGETDCFSGITGSEVPRFLDATKYQIWQIEDSGLPNFYANMRRRPGNDTSFRKALWYCLDRDRILEAAHYGYGKIPRHMLATPYDVGGWIPPETVTEPINLTKAAEILDEGGYLDIDGDGWREYPDGDKMALELTVSDYERFLKAAEIIIDNMRKIGVNIKLDILEAGQWGVRIVTTHDFDLTYFRYGPGGGDPLEPLSWLTSWGENWIGFFNETYDDLYLNASVIFDEDERRPLIWDLQRILAENYAFVPHVCNINLKALNIEKFDPMPNSMPWGPFSNLQSWHYYNLHLRGAPGAVSTTLTIDVSESAMQNEPVPISATLMDEKGSPIEGMYIDFYVGGLSIGAATTDSNGVAVYTWIPINEGSFEIRTDFSGTEKYKESESTTATMTVGAVAPPPPPPSPPPNYTPYYIAAAVVVVAIGAALIIARRR